MNCSTVFVTALLTFGMLTGCGPSSEPDPSPADEDPLGPIEPSPDTQAALEDYYSGYPQGRETFSELFVEALETALTVEDQIIAGRTAEGRAALDSLFSRFPISSEVWGTSPRVDGAFIGSPPAYAALRMLDEIVASDPHLWRDDPHHLRMRIVLAACAEGHQPDDLSLSPPGTPVTLSLAPELRSDDYHVIRQSLQLFSLYIRAITDGRLALDLEFSEVEDCVEVHFQQNEYTGINGIDGALGQLSREELRSADFFWVLYPSNVPEGPPFESQHFFTGGLTWWESIPVFLIDDKWLLRHAPHHAQGPMHEVERRVYLPQWLQHEFFHFLFFTWPELGLESTPHQWFDYPGSWPEDFVGGPATVEPDYFAEAITKRLRDADPPLHIGLRSQPPSDALLASLELDSFIGNYERRPILDDWHRVHVEWGSEAEDSLIWTNEAGVQWSLSWDGGELVTGEDCPYGVQPVTPILARDSEGDYVPELTGLRFLHENYHAIP